ncbi:MAG: hypothetical protein E7559_03285 [Ruminococcaceae bacterium]|nr:hypothetical protein [Oscillospiraceae bacterium]
MAVFFVPPIPLIRRNHIINKLRQANATSEATAKTFAEAGIVNPNGFSLVTKRMVDHGILGKTEDGRYYLK